MQLQNLKNRLLESKRQREEQQRAEHAREVVHQREIVCRRHIARRRNGMWAVRQLRTGRLLGWHMTAADAERAYYDRPAFFA